jgi:hypothetical protein
MLQELVTISRDTRHSLCTLNRLQREKDIRSDSNMAELFRVDRFFLLLHFHGFILMGFEYLELEISWIGTDNLRRKSMLC